MTIFFITFVFLQFIRPHSHTGWSAQDLHWSPVTFSWALRHYQSPWRALQPFIVNNWPFNHTMFTFNISNLLVSFWENGLLTNIDPFFQWFSQTSTPRIPVVSFSFFLPKTDNSDYVSPPPLCSRIYNVVLISLQKTPRSLYKFKIIMTSYRKLAEIGKINQGTFKSCSTCFYA